MKYELWQEIGATGEATGLAFFPVNEGYERQLQLLAPGAKLIWAVEADSWDEAMTLYHERMGWSAYRPLD